MSPESSFCEPMHVDAKSSFPSEPTVEDSLTIEQAANSLMVSQKFILDLIESKTIRSFSIENRLFVSQKELLDYEESMRRKRLKSLEELTAMDQELGFY